MRNGPLWALTINIVTMLADNYLTLLMLGYGFMEANPIKRSLPFEYWFPLDLAVLVFVFLASHIICMNAGRRWHALMKYWWAFPMLYGLGRIIPIAHNIILLSKYFGFL